MKHPIYKTQSDRDMMQRLRELGNVDKMKSLLSPVFIEAGRTDNECSAFVNRIDTLRAVQDAGCVLIQLKDSEHWNESMSEKTIKKMSVDDIFMPYPAFTIDLTNAAWSKYEYVHILTDGESIVFTFEIVEAEGTHYHQMKFERGRNIEDEVEAILSIYDMQQLINVAIGKQSDDMREVVYKCISIIMFTSMFQKVTDRVLLKKVANKGSKKRGIPNHTTSIVYLSQPTYSITGKNTSSSREASSKTWMQKGHFRRQPYGSRSTPTYKSNIIRCANGKIKSSNGFIWEYEAKV